MRIELTCSECGGSRFTLDGDVADTSHIKCKDCGHEIGTMGDLKRMVATEALLRSSHAVGKSKA